MHLESNSLTPMKSILEVKVKGKCITKKFKYINKKGTYKACNQCSDCKHKGKVHMAFGYTHDATCDRDVETWRSRSGYSEKPCKYFSDKTV